MSGFKDGSEIFYIDEFLRKTWIILRVLGSLEGEFIGEYEEIVIVHDF